MKQVDMAVIGTGPAGQKAAIQAAKLGKRVMLVERDLVLGGACINTGTIPSKALREAVLHLVAMGRGPFYQDGRATKREITFDDLTCRCESIMRTEREVIRGHLLGNEVELVWGEAQFEDPHTIRIVHGSGSEVVRAQHVVIATGTVPTRPP